MALSFRMSLKESAIVLLKRASSILKIAPCIDFEFNCTLLMPILPESFSFASDAFLTAAAFCPLIKLPHQDVFTLALNVAFTLGFTYIYR